MLPGEGRVRRSRRALTEPRQGDLSARLLGDRRRFSSRWRHDVNSPDRYVGFHTTRERNRSIEKEERNDVSDRALLCAEHIFLRTTTLSIFAIADDIYSLAFLVGYFFFFFLSLVKKVRRTLPIRSSTSRDQPRRSSSGSMRPGSRARTDRRPPDHTKWREIITNPTQLARPTQPCASSGLRGLPRVVSYRHPSLQEGRGIRKKLDRSHSAFERGGSGRAGSFREFNYFFINFTPTEGYTLHDLDSGEKCKNWK